MALAVHGGHRECVRLLQAAGWPSQRAVADDDVSGLGGRPAEDSPGNGEQGEEMVLDGFGRGGVSDSDEGRRYSSSLDESDDTSALTGPPAEVGRGGGENEQGTRAAPPACSEQYHPWLTLAQTTSPRRHTCAAARTPSARLRSSRRVLSMDMALPGLRAEGATPSHLQQLLEAPVLHAPLQRFPAPAVERQRCDRSTTTTTTPSCSTIGAPRMTPSADGFQEGGVDAAGGREGFCLEELRWLSEGASGIIEDGDRCLDTSGALDGFVEVEEALAVGVKKSRVRDVWSPVSGEAGALEVRLAVRLALLVSGWVVL